MKDPADVRWFPKSAPILRRWESVLYSPTDAERRRYYELLDDDLGRTPGSQAPLAADHGAGPLDALQRRMAALERRLESDRRGLSYRGTWNADEAYREGDFVTDKGSMWYCKRPSTTRPGTSDAWQLAVKSGKDRRR